MRVKDSGPHHSLRGCARVIKAVTLHRGRDHVRPRHGCRVSGGIVLKPAEEVLQDLIRESNYSVHSDSELVGDVAKAAEKEDEERAKKQAEKSDKDKDNTLRRKPGLRPLPELQSIAITPWEVLHVLGRSEEHTSELQSREKLVCR